MLKEQIQQDLKTALLGGDKITVEILRGLKSAILYEEVAKGAREAGLTEDNILMIINREVKKRLETAEIYKSAGESERARKELFEKSVIEKYLPEQMNDEELNQIINQVILDLGESPKLGQIISAARGLVGARSSSERLVEAIKIKFQEITKEV